MTEKKSTKEFRQLLSSINDLQKDLTECLEKLSHHTQQVQQYDGWQQVLAANADSRVKLDIDDWLFFFGRS